MKKDLVVADLFCGAGGASMGMFQAEGRRITIVGFDIRPQPEYPFGFIPADVTRILPCVLSDDFDFIWASPPCQAYSFATARLRNAGKEYPDLMMSTRDLLLTARKPYVIENVCSAPMRKDLVLCGEMFGLGVIRHRAFQISGFKVKQPKHLKHRGTVRNGYYVTVAGHGGNGRATLRAYQGAMGIPWMTDKKALTNATPPAYAHYIFKSFLEQIN